MRATISFDIDINRVSSTMCALVLEEAALLNDTCRTLDDLTPETVLPGLEEVIQDLTETTAQLERYRQMLIGFERARFETVLPQSAQKPVQTSGNSVNSLAELREAMQNMQSFDSFLGQVTEEDAAEEEPSPETTVNEKG
jgi:hypothetical protein